MRPFVRLASILGYAYLGIAELVRTRLLGIELADET